VTRIEYQNRALDALRRRVELERTGYKICAVLFAILLAWTWVFHLGASPGWEQGMALLLGFAGIFFGIFWWSFLWKPVSEQYDLICPDCGASLLGSMWRVSVIETLRTGKCQKCGFEALTGEMPPPRPFSAARRRSSSRLLFWLVMLFAWIASRERFNRDFCSVRYVAAPTAADTADVDDEDLPLAPSQRHTPTCRSLRR
jgi:predicted RNA-binding Zn-ribbon protein involved in translation (DUF1610 family)